MTSPFQFLNKILIINSIYGCGLSSKAHHELLSEKTIVYTIQPFILSIKIDSRHFTASAVLKRIEQHMHMHATWVASEASNYVKLDWFIM